MTDQARAIAKAVTTPNSDTPNSNAGFDLRAEPTMLTAPTIEKSGYVPVQLIYAYTHNFASSATAPPANHGGSFLIACPGWKGDKPEGIKAVM